MVWKGKSFSSNFHCLLLHTLFCQAALRKRSMTMGTAPHLPSTRHVCWQLSRPLCSPSLAGRLPITTCKARRRPSLFEVV